MVSKGLQIWYPKHLDPLGAQAQHPRLFIHSCMCVTIQMCNYRCTAAAYVSLVLMYTGYCPQLYAKTSDLWLLRLTKFWQCMPKCFTRVYENLVSQISHMLLV